MGRPRFPPSICLKCGVAFRNAHHGRRAKYCSRACVVRPGKPRTKPDQNCPVCGRVFRARTPTQRYCSRPCVVASGAYSGRPRKHADQTCAHCGIAFRSDRGPLARRVTRYCSQACGLAASRGPRVALTCAACARAFERWPSLARQRYCSQACAQSVRRKPRPRCEVCGGECRDQIAWPRRFGSVKGPRRFCSRACAHVAQRRPKPRRCRACGVAFDQFGKHKPHAFCSIACQSAAAARRRDARARRLVLRRLLRLLRRRRVALRAAARLAPVPRLGAFCWLRCPNCGAALPRDTKANRRAFCGKRCERQISKRYGRLFSHLRGEPRYQVLLTVGLLKQANRETQGMEAANV